MSGALNTNVNGSSGTCDSAASMLRSLSNAAQEANDGVNRAMMDRGWFGEARISFTEAVSNVGTVSDEIAGRARRYARGISEFASALDGVVAKMNNARQKASNGGLRVDGPFILPPGKGPGPKPQPPAKAGAGGGQQAMNEYNNSVQQHNAEVAEHNRKTKVFNECNGIVQGARRAEAEAHQALRQALAGDKDGKDKPLDAFTVGTTTISHALSATGTMENVRLDNINAAKNFQTEAQMFQRFADGTLDNVPKGQLNLFHEAAKEARGNQAAYMKKAQQIEKYIDKIPERARSEIVKFPGGGHFDENWKNLSRGAKVGGKFLKATPWVGSVFTVGTEAMDALRGEQSWGKALADSGGTIAGGAAGSVLGPAVASAAYGSTLGPWGTVIAGGAGAVMGAFGGQKIVDAVIPG